MIRRVKIKNFRCLRQVEAKLGGFHVLVGPNASGKSTFLDAMRLVSRLVSTGLTQALEEQAQDPAELFWSHRPGILQIELLNEFADLEMNVGQGEETARVDYDLGLELSSSTKQVEIADEKTSLVGRKPGEERILAFRTRTARNTHQVQKERGTGGFLDYWVPEGRSLLGSIPDESDDFPVALRLRKNLTREFFRVELQTRALRQPSEAKNRKVFSTDGAYLPWLAEELKKDPEPWQDWLGHLSSYLPDLVGVDIKEREEDRARYLVAVYKGGMSVPSWQLSEGTLRLMALTILAYRPTVGAIYQIEEPEKGVHPGVLSAIHESLSSVYDAQVLLTTHSPALVALAKPEEIMMFTRQRENAVGLIRGDQHWALKEWRREVDLGTLFASGVFHGD